MEDKRPAPIAVQRIVVTDFDIGFGNLVVLLIKFAFAVIPAAIVVTLVWMGIASVVKLIDG
ncbi:MAG: hypothetical protein HC872_02870 [Gammaproteobacteria bacterium]|nr:hypothetical protein [Gammaproteobacteria bacterium]